MKVYKVKWNMPYYIGSIENMQRLDKAASFFKLEDAEKFRNDLGKASVTLGLPEFNSSIEESVVTIEAKHDRAG